MSALHPLGDYVVAQAEKAETKTASGLYLPEKAAEKPSTSVVTAVGADVKRVKVGDKIVYRESYGDVTTVKLGAEEFMVIKEENILAVVK